MNKMFVFLVLFIIILAAIGYYMNIDRSVVIFERPGPISDEAKPPGEDGGEIPDFINEQMDSFS